MPSLKTAKRISNIVNNGANNIGQIHKHNADVAMDLTWNNDVQAKQCFIYDYYHDDQPWLKEGMTYYNTIKTKIDAKFIVKTHQSTDKDHVDYYLQFRPSQKTHFTSIDELYYFEIDYRQKYFNDDFVGMYVDIPDDKNIYRKWLIIQKEPDNQFPKYLILPINFQLMWIEKDGQHRYKRKMWSVLRNQSSYNSGIYTYNKTTKMENQEKCWLPLNKITEKIWYTDGNDGSCNTRVLVGAFVEHPTAWIVSKVENVNPAGIQKLTFYQDDFDQNRDYLERDEYGNIVAMWADYYDIEIPPTDTQPMCAKLNCKINVSTPIIKVGGSYKLLTAKIFDSDNNEVTNQYLSSVYNWKCFIKGKDITNSVSWLVQPYNNQIKIKFPDKREYLNSILHIECAVNIESQDLKSYIDMEIII